MSKVRASSSHMSERAQKRRTIPARTATTAPTTISRMNQAGATHDRSGSSGVRPRPARALVDARDPRFPGPGRPGRARSIGGASGMVVVGVPTSTADASTVSTSAW